MKQYYSMSGIGTSPYHNKLYRELNQHSHGTFEMWLVIFFQIFYILIIRFFPFFYLSVFYELILIFVVFLSLSVFLFVFRSLCLSFLIGYTSYNYVDIIISEAYSYKT